MCGIAGVLAPPGRDLSCLDPAVLQDALRHRGPDDRGILLLDADGNTRHGRQARPLAGDRVCLVHTRLAILDLGEGGHQPMSDDTGRRLLVFNGEIYNYRELRPELEAGGWRFRSRSDTEVLLAALCLWGVRALSRLRGMFACAFLDRDTRRLLLLRDPFGIKPLYYCRWRQGLAFASEPQALLQLPAQSRRLHAPLVRDYLCAGRSDGYGESFFAGIHQLPAAHYAWVELDRPDRVQPRRYWQPELRDRYTGNFSDAADELRERLEDSVRLHLRSDVPIGSALSGGLDSSAIVMAAARQHEAPPIGDTFSFIAADAAISEEPWVDQVNAACGARPHKVHAEDGDMPAMLEAVVRLQGEPFATTSILAQYRVYQAVHAAGIKVTLDGQGADELLAGYPTYAATRLGMLIASGHWSRALGLLGALPQQGLGRGGALLRALRVLLPDPAHEGLRRLALHWQRPPWLRRGWQAQAGPSASTLTIPPGTGVLKRQLYATLAATSLPALLRYADRNAMAWSVEARVPFLTTALAEFIYRLPQDWFINGRGQGKAPLRAACAGLVPEAVLRRRKLGFVTPEAAWLRDNRAWVEGVLASPGACEPLLDAGRLRHTAMPMLAGRTALAPWLWRVINLILWCRCYGVEA